MLCTMSAKSNMLERTQSVQRRPGIGQEMDVGLAEPLLLGRLHGALLLDLPALAVYVLDQCRVALAHDGTVVRLRADGGEDLEQVRALLDEDLERRTALQHRSEPLAEEGRGGRRV